MRALLKDFVLPDAGDRWSVKLDLRALGGHLGTTYGRRATSLSGRVVALLAAILVVVALLLDFCQ